MNKEGTAQTKTVLDSVTLYTDRLIMRPFRDTDIDDYSDMCADAEVMRFIGGKTLTRHEAWRSMAMVLGHWVLRGYGLWAVEEKGSGRLVGRVGCHYPEGWPGFEVGWALARPFWGKGFATEAAQAALNYAFTALNQRHVISLIDKENLRSIRVAERIGETLEGETELLGRTVWIYGIHR
jgi:RimJ/RimL family protein N-acetyltransferase